LFLIFTGHALPIYDEPLFGPAELASYSFNTCNIRPTAKIWLEQMDFNFLIQAARINVEIW
jgi:hypothetical protein